MRQGLEAIHKFSIKDVINQAMAENYDYEQRTITQLFERYQSYKPLASGIYG